MNPESLAPIPMAHRSRSTDKAPQPTSADELERLAQRRNEALESRSVGSDDDSTTWLTNEQLMEFLDVSRSTLNRYRMQDKLPYSKVGQKIYYRLEDIQELLEKNLRRPKQGCD